MRSIKSIIRPIIILKSGVMKTMPESRNKYES